MILVDTSVWIDHLHERDAHLVSLLEADEVLLHPFVLGELALGHLRQREKVLRDLQLLPGLAPASDQEVLAWVERQKLSGKGLNWVDAHLLLACLLGHSGFWTKDKRLWASGRALGVKLHDPR